MHQRPGSGFTLIELMVCMAIIGILAAIAVPAFEAYRVRARITVCISDLKVIEQQVITFFIDSDQWPDTLADAGLIGWKDPWGYPFQYLKIGGAAKNVTGKARKDHFMVPINTDFDLYSMGPDGKTASPLSSKAGSDDIIRANDGLFIGRAAMY